MGSSCLYYNGQIVDIIRKRVYSGWFLVEGQRFTRVEEEAIQRPTGCFRQVDLGGAAVIPGLVDIHAHVESSFTTPRRYAEVLLRFGTTTTLVDPHEIANVLGLEGIQYMLDASQRLPLNFFFSFPSCVPATTADLETTGASLVAKDFEELIHHPQIKALGEQMDYQGALADAERVLAMSELARRHNLLHEGHVPTLSGADLSKYLSFGIHTDHTLMSPDKIKEQLTKGVCAQLQEKSITEENIATLRDLPDLSNVVFVTDDIVGSRMIKGHLLSFVKKAIDLGLDSLEGLASATFRPARVLGQRNLGLIAPGYQADFVIVDNIKDLNPQKVFARGAEVYSITQGILFDSSPYCPEWVTQTVNLRQLKREDFLVSVADGEHRCRIITANEKNTMTHLREDTVMFFDGFPSLQPNQVWVTVHERHQGGKTRGVGIVEGFALTRGAYASTVGHDAHNLIVVGKDPCSLQRAARSVMESNGGLAFAVHEELLEHIPLPVAGLMSDEPVEKMGAEMQRLEETLVAAGVTHAHPLLFLVMVSLSTSPYFKVTDYGLVDVERREILSFFI